MRHLMIRGVALFVLAFLLVPAGFSKSPAKSKAKETNKATDDTTAAASDTTADDPPAADAPSTTPAATPSTPTDCSACRNTGMKPRVNFRCSATGCQPEGHE